MPRGANPKVERDEYERAVIEHPDHVVTVQEIADALDVSRATAYRRLRDLVDAGRVASKDLGGQTAYWHTQTTLGDHTPDESDEETGEEYDGYTGDVPSASETLAEKQTERIKELAESRGRGPEESDEPTLWTRQRLRDAVDVPGTGETRERRRDAVAGALWRIMRAGEIEAAALREEWDDNLGYASERSAWKNCALPAFQEARDEHGVPVEASQSGKWRWTG